MGERPPTKFQRVRAAVMANTEAAGRVDPPLRTPEARVHGVVMLLFLGWGKFEDRIAVSYIAQRCGWWDGKSTPKGEKKPRPDRHVRRRVGAALRVLNDVGLIGYVPARGAAGTEGYNLSVITLPKPKNGTASTGPIVGRATGADNGTVPTGPIVEESAKEQWGLVPARNGAIPRRVMGPPLLAPTEGYRGNQKGGRAPAADETDVVALRAHRLAALTPCDDAAALITARRVVELCTELGATLRQIDAVLAEHERDEDGMDDPIDLLFELGAIDLDTMARHPAYRTLAKEGVALAIIDNSRGHWLDNAPAAFAILQHVEHHAGGDQGLLEEIAAEIRAARRLDNPNRAMQIARAAFELAGLELPRLDLRNLDRTTATHPPTQGDDR
ncbi:MAG: hypothetical protein KA274_08260 [Ilumatobacteraceae bacterium]|nr:hypothetical protein [Ilumatobacteraceae bacterium]MBP7621232.1 hypothetical protein [Gemmatimonadales bacterium]MBP7890703.1 hypothetical protein [Ilumatobacteraceae bacterium]MBP9052265.1 hypothetical protein [Ilumatobacteraceae bacterium]